MNELLKSGLRQLNFIDENKKNIEGFKYINDTDLSEYEKFHVLDAEKYEPDAVFFKKFENKNAIPIAYIYDNTSIEKSEDETSELYRKLWNSCKVLFFIIITKSEIKIFNCSKKPEYDSNNKIKLQVFEILKISSEINKTFNASKFYSGDFWNTDKVKDAINKGSGAYESLINELKDIRKNIQSAGIISSKTADSLLVKFILIKYLEERKVFKDNFWKTFYNNAESFIDLFDNGNYLIKLFDNLSVHFNGGIFRLTDGEKQEICNKKLKNFASFLRGDSEKGQGTLWRIYSFEYLPIELISNIYEEFLENKKGVVYTPPVLVNFMIDEIMPLDKSQGNYKVLDPSCGSGVFLVAAFKRLIQWWRIKNNYKIPDVNVLKEIIKNSLFGIDVESEASRLTVFSLSLAICDILSPDIIWSGLKFDDLREKNIINDDFFNIVNKPEYHNKFDIIIGNPPFESKLTETAVEINSNMNNDRKEVPDKQIALLFLEQSFQLCKKDGYVALIQPAGPLLYNNGRNDKGYDYRKYLFGKYKCLEVIDFTSLRSSLFQNRANVAVASVFFKNTKPDLDDKILHVTVRETKTSKEKLYFEIDKYDFHQIRVNDVINNKIIWKINLLGGGRVKHLVERFAIQRTLGEYLKDKKKNCGWEYQEGFNPSGDKKESKYLFNSYYLEPKYLTYEGIGYDKLYQLKKLKFEAPRPEKLYKTPLLIIREVFDRKGVIMAISKRDLSFNYQIIGIHSDTNKELENLYNKIHNNKFYNFWICSASGRFLVSHHSSIMKKDIDNLPFPENEKDLELNEIEKIVVSDTLDYMVEYCQNKQNPKILKNVTDKQLEEFGEVYCKLLNSVYKNFIPQEIITTESFICFPFSYGNAKSNFNPNKENMDKALYDLVDNKSGESLLIKKIIRLYDGKMIYLIKPKQLKYWLKSTAVKDADETFADLIKK